MNKRAIAILGAIFILIVGTLGFLIYSRSKSNDEPVAEETVVETPVVEETLPETVEPEEPSGAAVRLTDDAVLAPILFYTGAGISYFNGQGQLFQTDLDVSSGAALLSNKRELSIALKPSITNILWPRAGNSFIAQFGSESKPTWSYYDSSNAAYKDIPSQVYSLDWMPSGDKIMFVWVDANGKATLNISDPDTTGYITLTDLYEPDNVISIAPDGQNILFYRKQTIDSTKNTINMVSADGKVFSSIVKDGYNMGVLWSPDSKKFLFNKRDSSTQKYGLWIADIATGEIRNLNVYTTVNKVVWSKDGSAIYAGVPTTGVAGQGLTQDSIVKILTINGQSSEFAPGIDVDVQNLFLSNDEDILFFRNAQDSALYYIPVQ